MGIKTIEGQDSFYRTGRWRLYIVASLYKENKKNTKT